jgi:NAD(P)-dependent dehydrogenase (short-subunit alcohol dehydrogenase family)
MSVVLVTGSSTGIGLATALHFGRLGDGVYAGVRNIATATELTKAIEADVLVNNAGIGGGGPVEDVPVDWVKSLFETNYLGAIRMIQAVGLTGSASRRSARRPRRALGQRRTYER